MTLPSILKDNKQSLSTGPSRASARAPMRAAASAAPAAASDAPVTVSGFSALAQYQILNFWCWNAVGSAISTFYLGSEVGDTEIQASNAGKYIPDTNGLCSAVAVPGHGKIEGWIPYIKGDMPVHYKAGGIPCNKTDWPQKITNGTNKLQSSWQWYNGGPSTSDIDKVVEAIRTGNPVSMYIDWGPGRGAHVVVVYGSYMQAGTRMFNLADPYYGFETTAGAPAAGTWRGSMFTTVL